MRYSFKKIICQLVLVFFSLQIITPTLYAQEAVGSESFDPNAYYDIVSTSSVYSSISGTKISWVGEELQILMNGGSIILAKKNVEQIRKLGNEYAPVNKTFSSTTKSKHNTLKGLGIGAAVGAAAGITAGLLIANAGDYDDCDDIEECDAIGATVGGVAGAGIFVTSSLIGLLVGSVTKRKMK